MSSWSAHFLLTVFVSFGQFHSCLFYILPSSFMFVVTFIVGNKTFFICIKMRHGFIHCSASQRVLVAATSTMYIISVNNLIVFIAPL